MNVPSKGEHVFSIQGFVIQELEFQELEFQGDKHFSIGLNATITVPEALTLLFNLSLCQNYRPNQRGQEQ
jgi:hypothetical protein